MAPIRGNLGFPDFSWEDVRLKGPCVDHWLNELGRGRHETVGYDRGAERTLRRFVAWLGDVDGPLRGLDAERLVKYQQVNKDYVVLNHLKRWLREEFVDGRYSTASHAYTAVRSFFMYNEAMLPVDRSFRLYAEKMPVKGTLTIEEFRRVLLSCSPMYRAAFLCMFMGAMGDCELIWWSDHGLAELEAQLGGEGDLVEVSLPGRKRYKNVRTYYTFLGRDAVDALRVYMENRRSGDSIFITQQRKPVKRISLYEYWRRRLAELGLAKLRTGDITYRTGKNPHELRDLFRTQWTFSGANESVAEFCMGHNIDPLGYNKFMRDHLYMAECYRMAEPFLNIISNPQSLGEATYRRRITGLEGRLETKDREVSSLTRATASLVDQNAQLGKLVALLQDPEKLARLLAQV